MKVNTYVLVERAIDEAVNDACTEIEPLRNLCDLLPEVRNTLSRKLMESMDAIFKFKPQTIVAKKRK